MKTMIKNGRVIDPATGTDTVCDVLLADGLIAAVGPAADTAADLQIDAAGKIVFPGFIDLHVHLRDPGLTYKEDLHSGGLAAAAGGVTTVVAMPNTRPVMDTPEQLATLQQRAGREAPVHVCQLGAITRGQEGRELTDIAALAAAGCRGLSEDGKSVMDSGLYREALQLARAHDLLVCAHCEDINLVRGGVMNDDERARQLGLPGISNAVEDIITARDILLAAETGVRLHLCHCSTRASVAMVRAAKAAGIAVTAEACPHHFLLCSEDIPADDGNYKVNPPLRARADMEAVRCGLTEGVIDVVSTDHAPHAAAEKERPMAAAAFGFVGLEISAALVYTGLVKTGLLSLTDMAKRMSTKPAAILGLTDRGVVQVGKRADLTIFDPAAVYRIDPREFASKGRNTPFAGREVSGRVVTTLVDGQIVYQRQ